MGENNNTQRTLSWTIGLSVALGVPLLIIPSIGYFAKYVGVASIAIWGLSVIEGFFQNMAYGELAVDFTDVSGIPGYAQRITGLSNKKGLEFLGGFSSWGYWFAWSPIPSIFSLSITDLLVSEIPACNSIPRVVLNLIVGTIVLIAMFCMNYKGLSESAWIGYVMNVISLVPLLVIALTPIFKGKADLSILHGSLVSGAITGNSHQIILLFGLMGMAQWSACAWETAAIYGPEYKNPEKDTPKALLSCGFICLIVFLLIQTSCILCLGVDAVSAEVTPSVLQLAELGFGKVGGMVASVVMIVAMISIIQTGFAGASRAMASMAHEGNLPEILGRENKYGMPQNAMYATIVLNYVLIFLGSSSALVAASSVGYCVANGIALLSYVAYKIKKSGSEDSKKGFSMPRIWIVIIMVFGLINLVGYSLGLMYLNLLDYGKSSLVLCVVILLIYVPLCLYSWKKLNDKKK